MTLDQLKRIVPHAGQRAGVFLPELLQAMDDFEINTPRRIAAFLAQVAHESGSFRYLKEIASGCAYEGRADLGNTQKGDGTKFRGRGLIQVTGRNNYQSCSKALFGDPDVLLTNPELLETVNGGCQSAAWFWKANGLNEMADRKNSFTAICRKVNGGMNGYAERLAFYERAKKVLGC